MLFIILHYVSGCIGSCKVCSVQYDRMGLAYLNSALIILSILSPVEAANKPLDEKKQRIFGITARILIIISAVCWSVTAIVFRQLILSKIISLSIISVAVFVIAGKMYLTVRKHN